MAGCDTLLFFVNGRKVEVTNPDPEMTLLQYLRRHLGVTGTKLGCGEGGCGACTVMLSRHPPQPSCPAIQHYSANACLTPLCSLHGVAVTTVEGIGSVASRLHPVQERLASSHGSQCGFCTPGFVMSMYTLLRNHPHPSPHQLDTAFDGNLCRCTGYRPIIEGYKPFLKGGCGMGDQCCRNGGAGQGSAGMNGQAEDSAQPPQGNVTTAEEGKPLYDPTQEPIFPPYLKTEGSRLHTQSLQFRGERVTWYRPTSLKELLDIKKRHPDCRLVNGNTEIGIESQVRKQRHWASLVAATHVPQLLAVQHEHLGLRCGASLTLTSLQGLLKKALQDLPEFKTRVFAAFVEMLQWFAGDQVRNVAALGGNIMTASPISDLNPLLLACGATARVINTDGQVRDIVMNSDFFPGYRQTALLPSEILLSVLIPYTQQNEYFYGFKQATRKEDDIAIVNAGIRVLLDDASTVTHMALAFGGMAPVTAMATKTAASLIGRQWNEELLSEACKLLAEDLPLSAEAPGGMIQFRRSLTLSFFFKAYLQILRCLKKQNKASEVPLPQSYLSALQPDQRRLPQGSQMYEKADPNQAPEDAVHRPLVHVSAYKQTTGEAIYIDDMPCMEGELYMGLVLSSKAHARLLEVDPSPALAMDGVVDFVSYRDVPGDNSVVPGEEIYASDKVTHQGQIIGAVLAESQAQAQRAAVAVRVKYDPLEPVITIEEAIKKNAIFQPIHSISQGDVSAGWQASDHVLEGEVHVEAQEHFYLETMGAVALPGEDGEMEIWASTQGITSVQSGISEALNIPQNKIVVKTKRLGGGFGGKETRTKVLTAPLAVAAHKVKRPVRCVLDRDEDMMMTGTRHPVLAKYKVGFTATGRILALQVDMYLNAGNSVDLSIGVMDRAIFHVDNCYRIAHLKTTGYMCHTNLPSNTAFRGFGGPQAMLVTETCIAHVASYLGMAPEKLREMNFYKEGDKTHYNQILEGVKIQDCWQECMQQSDFPSRRRLVDQYNSENRWRKRGIAMVPTKFGLSFNKLDMNQGGALVHIYGDGSVLISHGGVEMGQGLHTKVIQVASRVLRVPTSIIHIAETATNTVPNTSPSAASMSSDIYGMAVKDACEKLRERLDGHLKSQADASMGWKELIKSALENRINLSASGFFIVPDINYDLATNSGKAYAYYSYGTACTEVEVDCLTGDHKVLRTDIVMDVGKSLNPTIDIGQIEGAFMQGYGLMLLEQYKVQPDGTLLTRGPGSYKIPSLGNVPAIFNVSLLRHSNNPRAVFSSKGIGEPPLFLASSALHAVQDAVMSARRDAGLPPFTIFHTPATPDRIRLACGDRFTQQFEMTENGPIKPWYVEL